MQKIGMHHDPKDDFDHPALPEGHPLRRHVLYRIARPGAPRRTDTDRIRLASAGDLPFLREMLFEAAFWRAGAPASRSRGRARAAGSGQAAGRLGTPRATAAVIAESRAGDPLGAAWYRFWSAENHSYGFVAPEVPELGLAVRPEFRRQGIGARLLRALLEQAGAGGHPPGQPERRARESRAAALPEAWLPPRRPGGRRLDHARGGTRARCRLSRSSARRGPLGRLATAAALGRRRRDAHDA